MEDQNILYIFVGDIKNERVVGDYPSRDNDMYNIKTLFDVICDTKSTSYNQKIKHPIKYPSFQGVLSYIVISPNFVYSVLTDSKNDKVAFDLLDELSNNDINKITTNGNKLSYDGINLLKNIHEKYEMNALKLVNNHINEVKIDVQKGVHKVINNLDDIKDLDGKSSKIKDGALLFKEGSADFRRQVWWQDMKFKIFIGLLVAGLIFFLILR